MFRQKYFFDVVIGIKGRVDHGIGRELIFYFSKEDVYDKAVEFFCSKKTNVPYPDVDKLMSLLEGKKDGS